MAKYQHQISRYTTFIFPFFFFCIFFLLLMKACEIDQLSESDGIKNRRGVVYEVLKKWIHLRSEFQGIYSDESVMRCFASPF